MSTTRNTPLRSTKTTLNLPVATADALRAMAAERHTTLTEVIRHALRVEQYLSDATKEGCRILIEDGDNKVKELLIF